MYTIYIDMVLANPTCYMHIKVAGSNDHSFLVQRSRLELLIPTLACVTHLIIVYNDVLHYI
jgi:hypothetical protein